MSLTPEQRVLRARLAAHTRWANAEDRHAHAEKLQAGFLAKFEREVDPNNELPADERLRRAKNARKAHLTRIALLSSKARAEKKRG